LGEEFYIDGADPLTSDSLQLDGRVYTVNVLNLSRVEFEVSPGTDSNFQDHAAGSRNRFGPKTACVAIPHREIDEPRQYIFRIKAHYLP
jgi:hypothetical protein